MRFTVGQDFGILGKWFFLRIWVPMSDCRTDLQHLTELPALLQNNSLPFPFQLFDCTTLEHLKTFRTERPVNSAALSPIFDHVRMSSFTLTVSL